MEKGKSYRILKVIPVVELQTGVMYESSIIFSKLSYAFLKTSKDFIKQAPAI